MLWSALIARSSAALTAFETKQSAAMTDHKHHDDDALFADVQAVADAGGVEPFAMEVLAESDRIFRAHLDEDERDADAEPVPQHRIVPVIEEVIVGRLRPDLERELSVALQGAAPSDRQRVKQQWADRVRQRMDRLVVLINEPRGVTQL